MTHSEPSRTRSILEARLADLRAKVASGTATSRSVRYAVEVEIPRTKAAFLRLAAGTYGECIECGERIDGKRLAAIPEVPTCKPCEKPEPRT